MELISKKDVELLDDKYAKDIMKQALKKQIEIIEPHEEEIKKISSIIINFLKDRKRKIYGGYALNLLIKEKNSADAIYTDEDIPDIDFYSPEPINDLVQLSNIIYKSGFNNVMGREALHKETYSIKVNGQLYSDITYVPKNIYNRMPYREIDGLNVIGPEFMMIDYYRMMTDFTSYWRIEKAVNRFYLLQKYYPLPYINSPITLPRQEANVINLLDTVLNFLRNNTSCITIGFYAYDQFLKNSDILSSKTASAKKFKYLQVPYYEIIATEYKTDSINLIKFLKESHPFLVDDIHIIEYYPFFQYLGYSVQIYYKKTLLAHVYSNNKRCVPYISVPADKFGNKEIIKGLGTIQIGTFSTVVLYLLIMIMKARVDQDKTTKDLYYTLISHLIEMRNYYFTKTGKTIYDKTIFQDFIMECKGIPLTPERERQQIIEYRKKHNKRLIYSYDPQEGEQESSTYRFLNSSGNAISNIKNLRLTNDEDNEEQEE